MNSYKVKVDYFRYILDKEEKVCWCYDVADRRKIYSTLKIPENIKYQGDTYKVIGLDDYGFYETKVRGLILPESIESIGISCCAGSYYLEKVTIPASCKVIEGSSFIKCIKLGKVIFKGNPEKIDIRMFAFSETEYIRRLKEEQDKTTNNEGGYIGKNLVTVSCKTEELHIRPNTDNVYITRTDGHILELKSIYFPKGLKNVELDIVGIKNHNISAHFEDINDLLNCHFNKTLIIFSKLYIGDKEIDHLDLPKDTKIMDFSTLVYFCQIQKLKLNPELETILGDGFYSKGYKYIDNLYLPSSLKFISYNSFYKTSIKFFSSRYSTLNKLATFLNYSDIKAETLTIYIDEVNDGMFCYLNKLLSKCFNIHLIPIKKFSPKELYKILTELTTYTTKGSDRGIILDEDFLEIDAENSGCLVTDRIFVNEAYFKDFKSHKYWSKSKELIKIPDKNGYVINSVNNNTCSLCFRLDKYNNNDYTGIIKIPKKTMIDNELYKVTGISSFAFTDCHYLEEVVISSELSINDLAFEDSYENIKITKL